MIQLSLRWRVALAVTFVVVPCTVGFALFSYHLRREALLETTYEAALSRMENGGRERCEAREVIEHRRALRRRGRRGRDIAPILAHYDARYASSESGTLDAAIIEALEAGETAILDPRAPRATPRVVLRMPWDEGDCVVLVVPAPRAIMAGGFVRDLGFALAALVLALLAATLALGPPLRRLARLSSAVEGAGSTGAMRIPDSARGKDEIGVLAEALERAGERAQKHVGELEARDQALREYVDGTTHDLALPLTVLQGHLDALGKNSESGEPADPLEIAGASASANYLAQLSANLAAAARLDGSAVVERRSVDLSALIERVLGRLSPIAKHREVELASSLPDAPVLIVGDELLLERALANLVHNAIRHRTGPGHVAVLLHVSRHDAALRLTVKSDGTPMSDEQLETLQRGEVPADRARTRGRGLGLSIVRKVAALHDLKLSFVRGGDGSLEVGLTQGPKDAPETV